MYFHASFTKLLILAVVAGALSASLLATMEVKRYYTGSTPYFYAFSALPRYVVASAFAALERGGRSTLAAVGVFASDAETTGSAEGVAILTYHRILEDENTSDVTVARFRDQMHTLAAAGWKSISLGDFRAFMDGTRELPERSFLITFDDGAKDSFYPVDPILNALDYKAAMFVIVQSSDTQNSTYYLSPEELRLMFSTGRWEIGSHSYDGHRPYPVDEQGTDGLFFADRLYIPNEGRVETPDEFRARVRDDLTRAKEELERRFAISVDTFAFPLGNETGIGDGAANHPSGPSVTEEEASKIYRFGFLQTDGTRYSFNYPGDDPFLAYRIHVDYDWDGERLLAEMEGGLPKTLPFEDDFAERRGWLAPWGTMERGRNNLVLTASPDRTSASAMLDGTKLWDSYSFDASMDWQTGSAFLLADVKDSHTYHSCAFSPGVVEIQSTTDGETRTLARRETPRIAYGADVRAGIRVHGSVIECTWDYESIVESYERARIGGIGIQAWNETPGEATLRVSSVLVRPF